MLFLQLHPYMWEPDSLLLYKRERVFFGALGSTGNEMQSDPTKERSEAKGMSRDNSHAHLNDSPQGAASFPSVNNHLDCVHKITSKVIH